MNMYMYLSFCLSVLTCISETTRPNFIKFPMRAACGRGSVLLCRRCIMLSTSGFVDAVRVFLRRRDTIAAASLQGRALANTPVSV